MSLFQNLKEYFEKKDKNEETGPAPEGVCPNCWGHQNWDSQHYKFIKGQKANPGEETYDNFIKEVVRKTGKIEVNKYKYVCETCQVNYKDTI